MSKKIKIMLIDDNDVDLFIHREFIQKMAIAHSIVEYQLASKAFEFLESNNGSLWPDLILVDIYMPGMSGFDFMDKYGSLPESLRQTCTVIFLSSTLNPEDELKIKENKEILQLLKKPLNVETLKTLLENKKII